MTIDNFAYMMAAEKMVSLLMLMEQTFMFIEEYKIEADEEVTKALNPMLDKLKNWANNKKG